MHVMEVLDPTGHLSLTWDPEDEASVAKARAEFERLKAAGYTFYSVPVRLNAFGERAGEVSVEVGAVPAPPDAPAPKRRGFGRRKQPEGPVKEFEPKSERTVATPPMRGG
jgi:hypothetical protein